MKIKNIACIGAGYVGGPTMAVIALKCPEINVTVVDIDINKIKAWNGPLENLPVFEPGLSEIIEFTRNKNLFFSNDIEKSIYESDMIFMAVNTPTKETGEGAGMASDLKYVIESSKMIAKYSESDKIIIEKSTLPVRTAEKIKEIVNKNSKSINFEILSNPEFLAEGTAIQDLFKSDRVLIGSDQTDMGIKAADKLSEIYERWIPKEKILRSNIWSSELSKLASNAMLAQRISSINSLSALCSETGADIDEVSKAIGMDHRIGSKFLKVSPGFGGSCFKKDILNLVYLCQFYGLDDIAEYWYGVVKINHYQQIRITEIIENYFKKNSLEKKISILGWAFKKNTNDSRESASIYITYKLLKLGFKVIIYDPMISREKIIKDINVLNQKEGELNENYLSNITVYESLESIVSVSKIIAILTEWDEFLNIEKPSSDYEIFDFRNILNKKSVKLRL
tara:strand:- start:16483 stop:17838 length:1356 start_codon:yes stop_codon:yes gene_type:complete